MPDQNPRDEVRHLGRRVWRKIFFLLILGWSVVVTLLYINPFPVPFDQWSFVFATKTLAQFKAAEVILASHGHYPILQLDTDKVKRLMYPGGLILNYTAPDMLARLGNPQCGITLVMDNPIAAVNGHRDFLDRQGLRPVVYRGVEKEVPPDDLIFMNWEAGWPFVFRKSSLNMGGPKPAMLFSWFVRKVR